MDLLDKIIMQEANSVTPDDYERLTGTSLEESMARMKEHMAEVKARVAMEKKVVMMPTANTWQVMPMAAATPRSCTKRKKGKK